MIDDDFNRNLHTPFEKYGCGFLHSLSDEKPFKSIGQTMESIKALEIRILALFKCTTMGTNNLLFVQWIKSTQDKPSGVDCQIGN